MNKIFTIISIGLMTLACKDVPKKEVIAENKTTFNQTLADELNKMAKTDQVAAYIPQEKHKDPSKEDWNTFKDIFSENGFAGYDAVGQESSKDFWLMVQHCDHNPTFQKKVLENMKIEVDNKNADPGNYGLLEDRINSNTGNAQIYGTQVTYNFNTDTGQAYPKTLEDSVNVNKKRKPIGLEPLEVYLNEMTKMHYEVNKEGDLKLKGIKELKL